MHSFCPLTLFKYNELLNKHTCSLHGSANFNESTYNFGRNDLKLYNIYFCGQKMVFWGQENSHLTEHFSWQNCKYTKINRLLFIIRKLIYIIITTTMLMFILKYKTHSRQSKQTPYNNGSVRILRNHFGHCEHKVR